jgi:hypothetical protein
LRFLNATFPPEENPREATVFSLKRSFFTGGGSQISGSEGSVSGSGSGSGIRFDSDAFGLNLKSPGKGISDGRGMLAGALDGKGGRGILAGGRGMSPGKGMSTTAGNSPGTGGSGSGWGSGSGSSSGSGALNKTKQTNKHFTYCQFVFFKVRFFWGFLPIGSFPAKFWYAKTFENQAGDFSILGQLQ